MNNALTDFSLHYKGFDNTQLLWLNSPLQDLNQCHLPKRKPNDFSEIPVKKYRLGHLVEQFVFHDLKQSDAITVLATNCQIKLNKRTIGELDCIILKDNSPIHLEIIYKFYLYDPTIENTELDHWIGPNRADSLIEKITKLKNKQLPLLFRSETQPLLNSLNLNVNDIQQQVLFKAQLFVPLGLYGKSFPVINNACIIGYYINYKQLNSLSSCQFYIPQKLDWLIDPHLHVEWLNYDVAKSHIMELIDRDKSPLCWVKSPNNNLQKVFITWW
ncbi:MAG: DUF1853 family protein [Flavobacteriaceae bacterium]